jgi:thiol-disulfide isomerase/thioredoxin
MKTNTIILIIIILVAGVGAALAFSNKEENKAMTQEVMESDIMMEEGAMTEEGTMMEEEKHSDGAVMEKDSTGDEGAMMMEEKTEEGEVMMTSQAGSYEEYDAAKLAAMGDDETKIISFHADWCPTCRSLSGDIEKNASEIPAGVTIFKANYDKETALRAKYGVTYQHTLVQVDSDGNMIKKWSGSPDLASVINSIQS